LLALFTMIPASASSLPPAARRRPGWRG